MTAQMSVVSLEHFFFLLLPRLVAQPSAWNAHGECVGMLKGCWTRDDVRAILWFVTGASRVQKPRPVAFHRCASMKRSGRVHKISLLSQTHSEQRQKACSFSTVQPQSPYSQHYTYVLFVEANSFIMVRQLNMCLDTQGECIVAVKADCDYWSKTELSVRLMFIPEAGRASEIRSETGHTV